MTDAEPVADTSTDQLDRLIDATNRLTCVAERTAPAQTVTNHATVTMRSDNLIAIVVGSLCALMAFTAMLVAVAAVLIVWGWREADMRDLTRVRGDVRELQAYRVQHGERITTMEARNVESIRAGRPETVPEGR